MSMKDYYAYPSLVDPERERRGITREASTVEEWEAILPDSYKKVLHGKEGDLIVDLRNELESGPKEGMAIRDVRDVPRVTTLAERPQLTPQTVFQVIRGASLSRPSTCQAFGPSALESNTVGLPLDF